MCVGGGGRGLTLNQSRKETVALQGETAAGGAGVGGAGGAGRGWGGAIAKIYQQTS